MTEVEKVKELQEVVDMILDANFAMVGRIKNLEQNSAMSLLSNLTMTEILRELNAVNKALVARVEKLEALLK